MAHPFPAIRMYVMVLVRLWDVGHDWITWSFSQMSFEIFILKFRNRQNSTTNEGYAIISDTEGNSTI
jgi:hypothetical protein